MMSEETLLTTSPLRSDSAILRVLGGERLDPPPIWMMRQAGRYLPEYRALRADKGGFLELCYDSDAAAEVTLQPIHRFDFDAAILFSDILVVPHAMGQQLWFEAGEGPRLAPRLADAALEGLTPAMERLEPVYGTVRRVRAALAPDKALLGFAGSPWTVATYMIHGAGSKDQAAARRMAYAEPARFAALIAALVDTTAAYLIGQIDAGVDAVQLFDSWAGSLAPDQLDQWVIAPNRAIVERVKAVHPTVPIIGFPKGAGSKLAAYARDTGVDAIGLDETVDPVWADSVLPAGMPVQGNLDPLLLIAGGEVLTAGVQRIRRALANRPHIFNLGHGIVPDTPIAHVEAMIAAARAPYEDVRAPVEGARGPMTEMRI
jgi:uroporphyrinogen decarboxylase